MKKLLIIALLIGAKATVAQQDSIKNRIFQLSFFYPLGTNGISAIKRVNNLSINVLGGVNGGLQGAEFGGLLNSNNGDVLGFQAAGIANVTNGSAYGIYSAGISNTINGDVTGVLGAGISNIVNGNSYGIQLAGISNINSGNYIGLQASGITNINGGDIVGGQFSLVNRAQKVTGAQVGLINIANSYDRGMPIGLFSFVKDGYHALEFSAEEVTYANVKLKLGVERFYNIFKAGFTEGNGSNLFTYGYGVGSMLNLGEKARLSIDLSANHLKGSNSKAELELLNKADIAFRFKIGKYIDVFAGPTFNVYVTENSAETAAIIPPYTVFQDTWWNGVGSTSLWIGGQGGLAVNF